MATDFFEKQDQSRSATTRLIFYLILGLVGVAISSYLIVLGTFLLFGVYPTRTPYHVTSAQVMDKVREESMSYEDAEEKIYRENTEPLPWKEILWKPYLFLIVVSVTLLIVIIGSLVKIYKLSRGGKTVAERLGAQKLDYQSADLVGKRLINVVQEMALASGVSAPPVYLLDEEGINAFAAGYTPDDAVIGVTKGAAERLSRAELQGVIAHEFSHILNGDIKLNIRVAGIVHGLLVLGIFGYGMFVRAGFGSGHHYDSHDDDRKGSAAAAIIGLGLMVVGYVGTFFGNLVKAAVNRQREYLADASAVQFTRNPEGIADALKTIGGFSKSSGISHEHAEEVSHMFFGCVSNGWRELVSTHPPLKKRIKEIQPDWDGDYNEGQKLLEKELKRDVEMYESEATAGLAESSGSAAEGEAGSRDGTHQPKERSQALGSEQIDGVGQINQQHIEYARRMMKGLPDSLRNAIRHPEQSQALVVALLIQHNQQDREALLEQFRQRDDAGLAELVSDYLVTLDDCSVEIRYPLVTLAISQLRSLSGERKKSFIATLEALVKADEHIELFEWCLYRFLVNALEAVDRPAERDRVQHHSIHAMSEPCQWLLSVLAEVGHRGEEQKQEAYLAGMKDLDLKAEASSMKQWDAEQIDRLEEALRELNKLKHRQKRTVLQACARCIRSDGEVTVKEGELFRTISGILGCPMPPIFTD